MPTPATSDQESPGAPNPSSSSSSTPPAAGLNVALNATSTNVLSDQHDNTTALPLGGTGGVEASPSAYIAAVEKCQPMKSKYDRCYNSWYRHSFLKNNMSNACEDYFEDYQACVLEQLNRYNLGHLATLDRDVGPEQSAGAAAGG